MKHESEISTLPVLRVSTGWIQLRVLAEPIVRPTFKGYAPVLPVQNSKTGLSYLLFISAKSIADGLEPLRKDNGGCFTGMGFQIRKASDLKTSPYEIRSVEL